ncbi:sodium- and chloride-dependent GABA transporter 1 isoform X2 [Cyprinodon tularosa]|uniref:sodium- and chloride-dependent GABA transporter 1 isoform X2 n=1 Tax=Cyprinodon tularosa TaxID=77115 RepID=UPI0018E261AF|nr:sodium- and chloride-dependent GABA transporter 1 isoform X2 [Cyprinodon tularosa]
MEPADRVHPGRNRLCSGSGERLEVPLSLLQEWRRCLSGALSVHAGGVGDPSALHGADCGPVYQERPCSCPGHCLPTIKSSFQAPLPWQSCNNTWNTPNCTDQATNSSYSSTASQEFFNYRMLDQTSGVEEAGTLRWELFLILILAWILIYLCIFKGVKSTGKVVYFTALFPYVILIALLINNVQLPGASDGIAFFIVPEWEKLRSVEVWVNAAAQIFNSIGIGFGSLLAMSSYNSFNNNVLKDTLFISITNSLTSILAGFVIFSAFGYMSYLQGIPVSQLAVDGPGLVYVVYPQAFANMPVSQLWAVLFFFMLLCLGLDSEFAMVEVMVTSFMDEFYHQVLRIFKRKEFFVLVLCGVALLLGIPCVMQVGIYVFQLMDHYTAIVSIMFLAFFEIIAICWSYGVKRLSSNLEEMTGGRPNIFFRLCWLIVDPVLITVILIFSIIQFKPARYGNYVFPPWAQGVGWIIALASIIWIPLGAIHTLWVLPGSLTEKLKLSITPYALNKTKGLYNERGGGNREPSISIISSSTDPQKSPLETNF